MATTIQVQDDTWQQLNEQKEPGESFDEVVSSLIGPRITIEPGEPFALVDEWHNERIEGEHFIDALENMAEAYRVKVEE